MKKQHLYILIGAAALAFLLMARAAWLTITDWLIPQLEGFSATPYWDNKQYSWGYGTKAPGPTGTITRAQALIDARKYLNADRTYFLPMLTRSLNGHQWAAFLSFAYNLGRGNADNLLANINSGNDAALEKQWKLYINANGKPNANLIERRNLEWNIWRGQL